MKNHICNIFSVSLIVLLLSGCGNNKAKTQEIENTVAETEITFDSLEIQMGTVMPEIHRRVFTFRNTGNRPLVVSKVESSCYCATTEFTRHPVQPGDTGSVVFQLNGKEVPKGMFRRSATVYSNGSLEPVKLFVSGRMALR